MQRSEPQNSLSIRNPRVPIRNRIEGWLFDIDELGPSVTLWVYDDDGRLHRLTDEFYPPVYARGDRAKLKLLAADLSKRGLIIGVRWVQKREFWSGDEIEVLQLNVSDSSHLLKLRQIAAALDREMTFYNLDIPTPQHYLYLTKLFPLCRVEARVDERGAANPKNSLDSDVPIYVIISPVALREASAIPPLRSAPLASNSVRAINHSISVHFPTVELEWDGSR